MARPFYDQVNGPLFLALVLLMGVGPLIPWRRANLASLRRSLLWPTSGGLAAVAALLLLGIHQPYVLIGFGLCGLVTSGIVLEWARGTRSRHRSSGENYPLAFWRLLMANRPRYGGYVVHLAVVMVVLGALGNTFFSLQRDVVLAPGERVDIADYQIEYVGTTASPKSDRTEFVSTLQVYRDGLPLTTMNPKRSFYPAFNMASTRAAIRGGPVEDLYIVPSENLPDGSVGFRILVNPLMWWMWVAGPVLILGTVIALWPQPVRQTAGAASRIPTPLRQRPAAAPAADN